ncbi:MAG: hypothetical protein FWB85_08835 [Chitinispirillia bacterium]|jgi:hypothetical protein|nr:hypothetical protein [Chitinispirillia bacterium]MCL2242557.1 hypothetical protein [Chitinispirillia bacterium]
MPNIFYLMSKRFLVSKSRGTVRGSIIFILTHLLLIIGLIFTTEIILLLLGTADIHVPLAGKILSIITSLSWF